MILAISFNSGWLLLGLLAAAIPVVLHLLSAVRAPEQLFPTLRFLRISMQKTARRRRLEHWLLLILRSALLALLALAVAEPITRTTGGFLADPRSAAVLIVDNSYSMGVRHGDASRFARAVREAKKLLGGSQRPSSAALMLSNSPAGDEVLGSDLSDLRGRLDQAALASGRAPLPELLDRAADLLDRSNTPRKAIYLFTDLQRISFDGLAQVRRVRESGIPIMLVDCSGGPAVNVGISQLSIAGRHVVDQTLRLTATLVNSSPKSRTVKVGLQIDERPRGESVRVSLSPAGEPGSAATVRFDHRFAEGGPHHGHVAIEEADQLAADNIRRFSLDVAGRVGAVLVHGGELTGGVFDPAAALARLLDPVSGTSIPWSIRLRATVPAEEFDARSLAGAGVALFADVPRFTPAQAAAVERFVRLGGTAVLFLGPGTDVANYNDQLVGAIPEFGGLLPGRIGKAVGQIGLTAGAVRADKDLTHPYLAGLYETPADYPDILIQRYYRVAPGPGGMEKILSAPTGEPIVSAKDFGKGRVVLFATTASSEWNNLATSAGANVFLPMLDRIGLAAGEKLGADCTFPAGAVVTIRPRAKLAGKASINVMGPDDSVEPLPLVAGPGGLSVDYKKTHKPGLYTWQVTGMAATAPLEGSAGSFVTNIDGAETDLSAVEPSALAAAVKPEGRPSLLYHGDSLDAVHAAAAAVAAGDNFWDRLAVLAVLLLVIEAAISNRLRRGAGPVPAHLNPRLAGRAA